MTTSSFFRPATPAWLALLLLSLATSSLLKAQNPPDSSPSPAARLAAAPASSAWTIQYKYRQEHLTRPANAYDAAVFDRLMIAHPRLDSVQVTKAGGNRKEIYRYLDGSETIKFVTGDLFLIDERVSHAITIENPKEAGFDFKRDFYDLDWIKKAEPKGHQNVQGINCFVYDGKTPDGTEETAYIDTGTGLPLQIETPEATLTYTFRISAEAVELTPYLATHLKSYLPR